jgi:hypothetical protein
MEDPIDLNQEAVEIASDVAIRSSRGAVTSALLILPCTWAIVTAIYWGYGSVSNLVFPAFLAASFVASVFFFLGQRKAAVDFRKRLMVPASPARQPR